MVDVNEASRHGKGMEVVENGDEGYDSGTEVAEGEVDRYNKKMEVALVRLVNLSLQLMDID